jgi:Uma2 family endonuclease
MTTAALEHPGPWSEAEYFALPETNQRVELLDGLLLVTPAPEYGHQQWARRLANLLEAAAPPDINVAGNVNLRLGRDRILIPDVVVIRNRGFVKVHDAPDALLVAEVLSPSSVSIDRVLKPHLYAAAGIPWYLRVEPGEQGSPVLLLHELAGDGYRELARATAGAPATLDRPFPLILDPAALTRRVGGGPGI